ncbi:DUF481 domain-containing protein [Halomonas caseinilytica]|uniref:Putative salt-induced outer membrane protein n=1 Tax=Halomonas caseinilytica TaxID=438744 RepID=A0A1M6QZD1_9GAMM|nr:DUF481 domain-containing protein [Halomonas caseinilytica]SEM02408.1 putative salt-induced outer membrane protein [Halomonas caseinilytica]SHK25427.1 putative salt-induced outer membrane protein [Halomonas caseinilytica]
MRLKVRHFLWAGLGLLALVGDASARPFYSPPPPEQDAPTWSGTAELGYTSLSGNTDSQTLITKGHLAWLTGPFTHSLRGEIRHVTQDDETSAERYQATARERYDLNGSDYLFGFTRWDKDRFSGYNYQITAIAGYGRRMLNDDRQTLALEVGPGYRHDSLPDTDDRNLAVAYGALDYQWKISETASFGQELSLEHTRENLTSRALSSLTASLNDHLALKLSHEIEHNSRPPEDAMAKTDHTTTASLVYDW